MRGQVCGDGRDVLRTEDGDEVGPCSLQICGRGVMFGWNGSGEREGGCGRGCGRIERAKVVACQGGGEYD